MSIGAFIGARPSGRSDLVSIGGSMKVSGLKPQGMDPEEREQVPDMSPCNKPHRPKPMKKPRQDGTQRGNKPDHDRILCYKTTTYAIKLN